MSEFDKDRLNELINNLGQTPDRKYSDPFRAHPIDEERLTSTYPGFSGTSNDKTPKKGTTNEPIISHLYQQETIDHILVARKKGISINGNDYTESGKEAGWPTYVLTDARILCIIPKDGADEIYEIPYYEINEIEVSTGITTHKISIKTKEVDIDIRVDSVHESDFLDYTEDFLIEKSQTMSPDESNLFNTKRSGTATGWLKKKPDGLDNALQVTSRSAEELSQQAQNDVNPEWLTRTVDGGFLSKEYYSSQPLIDYIEHAEKLDFLVICSEIIVTSNSIYGNESISGGYRYLIVTDSRVLVIAGKKEENNSVELDYSSINSVETINESDASNNNSGSNGIMLSLPSGEEVGVAWDSQSVDSNDVSNYVDQKVDSSKKYRLKVKYYTEIDGLNQEVTEVSLKQDAIEIEGYDAIPYQNIAKAEAYNYEYHPSASIVAKGERNIVYKAKGVKVFTEDGKEIGIIRSYMDEPPAPELDFPSELESELIQFVEERSTADLPYLYSLADPIALSGELLGITVGPELKVEGWTDGSSQISADLNASSESTGKSRGIEIGPFTRSKSKSVAEVSGELSGEVSDNSFTCGIVAFRVYENKLVIDSDLKINLLYSDISNVYGKKDGLVIDTGSETFKIQNLSSDGPVTEATRYIESEVAKSDDGSESGDQSQTSSNEKLSELKNLFENDLITKDEYEKKKEEVLEQI